jgi:hypothetical protein
MIEFLEGYNDIFWRTIATKTPDMSFNKFLHFCSKCEIQEASLSEEPLYGFVVHRTFVFDLVAVFWKNSPVTKLFFSFFRVLIKLASGVERMKGDLSLLTFSPAPSVSIEPALMLDSASFLSTL